MSTHPYPMLALFVIAGYNQSMKITTICLRTILILGITLFIFACSKKHNEDTLLRKTKSSISYKTYYMLSKTTLPLMYSQLPKNDIPSSLSLNDVRLYLAYSWAVSQKNAFGFAETSLLLISPDATDVHKHLAHIINSMLMVNINCMKKAEEEFALSSPLFNETTSKDTLIESRILLHLIIGVACIYNEEFEHARYHFSILSQISSYSWPYKLIDAALQIKTGNIREGLIALKQLQYDPSVPQDMREEIKEQIEKIEKTTGPVESDFFWLRATGTILMDEMKKTASPSIKRMIQFLEHFKKQLSVSL